MWWNRKTPIRQLLIAVLANQETIMSGIQDLKNAVAKIADDLVAEQAVIQQVIDALKAGGVTDAQAAELVNQLQGSASTIETATASLQGALTPPPTNG